MSPLRATIEQKRIWIFRLPPDKYKQTDAIIRIAVSTSIYKYLRVSIEYLSAN